jgi:hypothetical protein
MPTKKVKTKKASKEELDYLITPFYLLRKRDIHGNSGCGVVAVGAVLPSKRCVMEWVVGELTETIFEDLEQIKRLHGHFGCTEVVIGHPPKGSVKLGKK